MKSRKPSLLPLLLALGALGLRLSIAWQPIPKLLQRNLPDDAYYYFVIAYHSTHDHHVSFDGLNLTNGFHPLWLILLLPIFARTTLGSEQPVHLALTFGAFFDALTVFLLFHITQRLTKDKWASAMAALLYSVNILPLLQCTNGLETALGGLLAALVWWQTLTFHREPTLPNAMKWGGLNALMFLARTDLAFLTATMGAYLVFQFLSEQKKIWLFLPSLGSGLLLVLPWLIWNWRTFGSVIQSSAIAIPYAAYYRQALHANGHWTNWIQTSIGEMLNPTGWLRGDFLGGPPFVSMFWWVAISLGILNSKRKKEAWVTPWLPVFFASGTLIFVHAFLRWYPRPWYFLLSAQAMAVGIGGFLSQGATRRHHFSLKYREAFFTALLVLSVLSGYEMWRIGLYPWQKQMREAATWISEHIPEQTRIGSLNAGIYGYYSGHTVINLDGVVNPKALQAIQGKHLFAYMVKENIEYFIDYDHALFREYAPFMGPGFPNKLQFVANAATEPYPPLGKIRAYRILPNQESRH